MCPGCGRRPASPCVLVAADIAGENDVSPIHANDDPVLADKEVMFFGQPLFAVAAETSNRQRGGAACGSDLSDLAPSSRRRTPWRKVASS